MAARNEALGGLLVLGEQCQLEMLFGLTSIYLVILTMAPFTVSKLHLVAVVAGSNILPGLFLGLTDVLGGQGDGVL